MEINLGDTFNLFIPHPCAPLIRIFQNRIREMQAFIINLYSYYWHFFSFIHVINLVGVFTIMSPTARAVGYSDGTKRFE